MTPTFRSVLFTNSHADLGGGEMALLAHIRHLVERAVTVTVVLFDSGPLTAEIEALGGKVIETSFSWQGNKVRSLRLIMRRTLDLAVIIRRVGPDLVISYTYNDFVFAALAGKLTGRPIVYRAQGEVFPDGKAGGGWLGHGFVQFVRFVRPRILCTTAYEARNMIRAGVPRSMVEAVHLGVPRDSEAPRDQASRQRPIVAIFGRLVRWKGQDVFVEALGELARRGLDFEAWIVGGSSFGDGDAYERELSAQIEHHGISGQVKLLGFRRDVPALMSRCDIVCHCSDFEPFGLVIVEAMMAGKPIVATDVSGPNESVIDGETGFLVKPRDPLALANRLHELIADAELRIGVGRSGRKRAEEHFDIEYSLARLDDECCRLLHDK